MSFLKKFRKIQEYSKIFAEVINFQKFQLVEFLFKNHSIEGGLVRKIVFPIGNVQSDRFCQESRWKLAKMTFS